MSELNSSSTKDTKEILQAFSETLTTPIGGETEGDKGRDGWTFGSGRCR